MNGILFQLLLLLNLSRQLAADVDVNVYNLKYRLSIDSWLIPFQPQKDGYDVCIQLVGACCFFYNQTITPTLTTFKQQKAIKFEGKAIGYSKENCYQDQLSVLIIGSNGDQDLTSSFGKYTFVSDINSSTGQLFEGAKFQFVLDIDDQQNLYAIKLPSLSNSYGDNSSYNQLQVILDQASSAQIIILRILAIFTLLFLI